MKASGLFSMLAGFVLLSVVVPTPDDKGRHVRTCMRMLALGFTPEELARHLRGFGFTVHI